MTLAKTFLLLAATLTLSPSSSPPATDPAGAGRLVVAIKRDASVGIIDLGKGLQVRSVPVGGFTVHEVAVSPDGHFAYAPIYGNAGVNTPGTNGQSITVIDLDRAQPAGEIKFDHGVRPHFPVFDPVSHVLYVTTELEKSITVIDPKTLQIIGSIPTGQDQSHMLAVSHDGAHGYTANVGPGTVSVLDLRSRKLVTIIPVAPNIQRIAVSMDDKLVFTADQTKPQVAVISTAARKVESWIPLPGIGYGSAPTPDGRLLLIALPATDQVAVIDVAARKFVRTIAVGKSPQAVVVNPDGKTAYASCIGSHQVAVIDLQHWQTTKLIEAGEGVDGLAWTR